MNPHTSVSSSMSNCRYSSFKPNSISPVTGYWLRWRSRINSMLKLQRPYRPTLQCAQVFAKRRCRLGWYVTSNSVSISSASTMASPAWLSWLNKVFWVNMTSICKTKNTHVNYITKIFTWQFKRTSNGKTGAESGAKFILSVCEAQK